MRRKKRVVLASLVVLNLTVIFSFADQDKRKIIKTHSSRDFYSTIFRSPEQDKRRIITNQPSQHNYSIKDLIPPQQQHVPGEIIVEFTMPLSDFEIANLIGEYLSQKIGDMRSGWRSVKRLKNNLYLIRFPENISVEQMVQVFERNPYVKYAEQNGIGHTLGIPNDKTS